MISLPPGVYSAIFGLSEFLYLQGTCEGSGEIQGNEGVGEGVLARTPDGRWMGNQSRRGGSCAGYGRSPYQNNTGCSPVAALDSQDRELPGSAVAVAAVVVG